MGERAAHSAVHLRHTTQTIRILHPRIVRKMRLADLAVFHKGQKMFGGGFLARMRPRILQARIECDRRAFERFQTHRAGHIRHASEALRTQKRKAADRVHRLRAVEQGETFLGFELREVLVVRAAVLRRPATVDLEKMLHPRR